MTARVPSTTLVGCLVAWAARRPAGVALRHKRLGVWREHTWTDYRDAVAATARMLWELGVRPGDHVAILSENRPEWLFADLGAQALGARAVGIYQTNPPGDVAYILGHSDSRVLFAEDQEQVDKAVEVAGRTPSLGKVVVFDPRGTRGYADPRLTPWAAFLAEGRRLLGADPRWFEARLASLDPGSPSMVVYTSGTTGTPKGALIAPRNALATVDRLIDVLGIREGERVLSYLPLCHVAEKLLSVFLPLCTGSVVHFGESIATVQEDLREVSPTLFLGVPRIWEKMHAGVTTRVRDASWLKRSSFAFWARKGAALAERRLAGRWGLPERLAWALGDLLVFRPLRNRLGLGDCRIPVTGAAPLAPEIIRWFHAVGVPIVEGYGQTECSGVISMNRPERVRIGTVGPALSGLECRIARDGEILVRGPNVFPGYLHDPTATAETVDAEGWLHTGDLGSLDAEGCLIITGRKKEILVTSGGKNISPERVENTLKTSPYIKEAVAVGDARKHLVALIQIDLETVGDWATRRGLPFTSYADLAGKPEIRTLVRAEVDRANDLLAPVEQVRTFHLLDKELSQDDGELTATQKVRRKAVMALYRDAIERLYRE